MNTLKQIISKTTLAAAAAAFGAALVVNADTGGSSCSDSTGSANCSGSDRACCISGTDSAGVSWNIHTCCAPSKECKVKYTDGSAEAGTTTFAVSASRVVSQAGCL